MSIKNGIVLNRMYTGSYLSTNLGHEVINMFQADDNNHYLYLNAKGNFGKRGKDVDTMLLVMGIGEGRVEVVGMAKNLQCVDGACCTLPRDLGETDYKVKTAQENFLKKVKYGKTSIFDIFGTEGQQSVYASYWVDNKNFFVPKDGVRLIIAFSNSPKQNCNLPSLNSLPDKCLFSHSVSPKPSSPFIANHTLVQITISESVANRIFSGI